MDICVQFYQFLYLFKTSRSWGSFLSSKSCVFSASETQVHENKAMRTVVRNTEGGSALFHLGNKFMARLSLIYLRMRMQNWDSCYKEGINTFLFELKKKDFLKQNKSHLTFYDEEDWLPVRLYSGHFL